MAIWTVFGHKMGKNGWIKSMSIWIKTLLNPTDNLHSLVFTKRQLRNSPPPLTHCDIGDDDGGDKGDDDVDDGDADDHGPKLQNVKYNVIMWTSEKI